MNRTFALIAAVGLLAMTGCGDPPAVGSGVDSAALTPVAPSAQDRDLKPPESPLAPIPLPAITRRSAHVGSAAGVAPEAATPISTPPISAAPASGGGFFQNLFGSKPANPASTQPTATPSGASNTTESSPGEASGQTSGVGEITLSDLVITHPTATTVHFEAKYVFTKGQPNPSAAYFVHLDPSRTPPKSYMGNSLASQGTFQGDMSARRGKGLKFKAFVSGMLPTGNASADAANWQGSSISNTVEFPTTGSSQAAKSGDEKNAQDKNSIMSKAEVGVGAQGRDYGEGIVTTPISAYFSAKQMIVFNIQIPHAMKEFKAFNDRNPKSQEEFDEKIIKEYGIPLPELPHGERYVYDPKTGQLMFTRPKNPVEK